jgi:iron complex transport system ATP-binding protein
MSLLLTSGLGVDAGHCRLISGLDWSVDQGEFWCVLGRNGAGKSSLLHVLAGLVEPSAGSVHLAGHPLASSDPLLLARQRGLMMQQVVDSFACSVFDAVAIGRTPWRIGRAWDDEEDVHKVNEALALVGMQDRAADDVRRLSGGERQRVALAALLAQQVPLMLLDEPTSHQDVAHQLGLMRLLQELSTSRAVIATCHDINLAARFATHALLIGEGFHLAGTVDDALTPDTLQRIYGCHFSQQGFTFIPA